MSTLSGSLTTSSFTLSNSKTVTPSSTATRSGVITVQTAEVDLNESASIATAGVLFLRNIGTTDTVRIGVGTGVYEYKMAPGESFGPVRKDTGGARLYLKSTGSTDTLNVAYLFEAN